MTDKLSRREFLKKSAMGVAALSTSSLLLNSMETRADEPKSKIVFATHSKAADEDGNIDIPTVQTMLNEAMKSFTGKSTVAESWEAIFPDLTSKDVIGIKVNCINRHLSSHPEVITTIVAGLKEIGVNENNVIVWDRYNWEMISAGYEMNTSDKGVRYISTDTDGFGYDKSYRVPEINSFLSSILTKECDYLINVPLVKDHDTAGVTASMKNHYGTVDNPGSLHRNNCDPYIPIVNSEPHIKDKTKLIICDALLGIYTGGPGGYPQWVNNQIIVGTDPVALDQEVMLIIDKKRTEKGLNSVERRAHYIKTAVEMGLGTNDPNRIEEIKLDLG